MLLMIAPPSLQRWPLRDIGEESTSKVFCGTQDLLQGALEGRVHLDFHDDKHFCFTEAPLAKEDIELNELWMHRVLRICLLELKDLKEEEKPNVLTSPHLTSPHLTPLPNLFLTSS